MNIDDYLRETLKSGDVINISGSASWWKIWLHIAYYGIRKAQKDLFKNVKIMEINNNVMDPNDDTHTCMFFRTEDIYLYANPKITELIKPNHFGYIFSCEPPIASFFPIDTLFEDDIRVYRYNNSGMFDDDDIKILLKGILPIFGTKYDIGQLMDIAINQTAGYPYKHKHKWFDMGTEKKVCSVAVASVFTYWRHELEKQNENHPRLFEKLNFDVWDKSFVKEYLTSKDKWSVEQTYPAMFGITDTHFDNEFKLISWIKNSKSLFVSV